MLAIIPIWIVAAVLIGFLGRRYRFGFWGHFFASVLLTPVVGVLLLLAATPTRELKKSSRR